MADEKENQPAAATPPEKKKKVSDRPVMEEFISAHPELGAKTYFQNAFKQFCAVGRARYNDFASTSDFEAAAKDFLEGK